MSSRAQRGICTCVSAAAILVGCEEPIEPFTDFNTPRVLVHSVLNPSADTQKVVIEMTNGVPGPGTFQAQVRITTPTGGAVTLRRLGNGPFDGAAVFFFTSAEHVVQPGGTYGLRIDHPSLQPITGSTTVPEFPNTFADVVRSEFTGEVFRPDYDTLRLSWARLTGARGYEVVFVYNFQNGFAARRSVFTDTSVTLAGNARSLGGDEIFMPGLETELRVIAVDDNYYTYYRASVDPFAGAPPSRLTGGALGVFGSVVPVYFDRFRVGCRNTYPNCSGVAATAVRESENATRPRTRPAW